MIDIPVELIKQYRDLQKQVDLFDDGECKAQDVKKKSSLLGIYGERDGSYMLRVRRTSGEATADNIRAIAESFNKFGIDHAHCSTRQDIQLHGTPGKNIESALTFLYKREMPFRGGGGNTFRNVATSPFTGISKDSIFDTTPYANEVWKWVFDYDRAYLFGRKFKLGFSCKPSDDSNGYIQDLGFIAKVQGEERGFEVWCGGGMGRGGSLGIKLFDFLSPKDIIRVSQAGIDLFYEYGNREVRSKARLRFILQERGEAEFRRLFNLCYEKTTAPDYIHIDRDYSGEINKLKSIASDANDSDEFKNWVTRSVTETKFSNIVSVRLFIKGGNFTAEQLVCFADILDEIGAPFFRVSIEQDAIIPLVHKNLLSKLYSLLQTKLSSQESILGNFEGQIHACIGAARCPIGVLKSPDAAFNIGKSLDELFESRKDKSLLYNEILDGIRVSGCGSSCALNQVASLGFTGGKKRIDSVVAEIYEIWLGGKLDSDGQIIAKHNSEWWIEASDIGTFVKDIINKYIIALESNEKLSFRDFTIGLSKTFTVDI